MTLRHHQPKPLTFLAGQALANSVGTAAIDFLLLIVAVPQYLQYVLCFLKPSQVMMLIARIHAHSDLVVRRFWSFLPSYHHISNSKHVSTAHWLWPNTFDFRTSNPELPSQTLMTDSNNVDHSILSFNMYQTLLTWSHYLNVQHHLVFTPITRLVQLPGASQSPVKLMIMAHASAFENDVVDSSEDDDMEREFKLFESTFFEPHRMANSAGIVYTIQVHRQSINEAIYKLVWNFNKLLAYFPNEHCQRLFWTNIGKYANMLHDPECFDAGRLWKMLERVFIHESIFHQSVRDSEKLQAMVRFCKFGHFNAWSIYGRFSTSNYDFYKMLQSAQIVNENLHVETHNGFKHTNMDFFLGKCFDYSYYARECMFSVPCVVLNHMTFFTDATQTALQQFCASHRLLTAAGIPDSSKRVQFQQFKDDHPVLCDYEYRLFNCCQDKTHDFMLTQLPRFAADGVFSLLLAAVNLNQLGRPHVALLYGIETLVQMLALFVKSNKHPFKTAFCYAWAVVCSSLNSCLGPVQLAWHRSVQFATVADVPFLVHTLQDMCHIRGCHYLEKEWIDTIYLPHLLITKSPSGFVTIMLHLDNLFTQLENVMALLLSKAIYKDLVNVEHAGTRFSLEKESWLLEQEMRHIITTYMMPLYFANRDNVQYKHYYLYNLVRVNLYCGCGVSNLSLADLTRFDSTTKDNHDRAYSLYSELEERYNSKIQVLATVYKDFIQYPRFFFNDEESFEKYYMKLKCKNRLEYSLETGNLYFTLGVLHLLAIYQGRTSIFEETVSKHGFFQLALQHYQVVTCNTVSSELHRFKLASSFAALENAVKAKVAPLLVHSSEVVEGEQQQQEDIPVIVFKDILCPEKDHITFLQDCFQHINTLIQETNGTPLQSEQHVHLLRHCETTINHIKSSKTFLAACFNVHYNQ